jgi:D-alanine transaminase
MAGSERIVYLNGEYLPQDQARVSVFDRGFLFGDGVYEVIPVLQGKLVDEDYSVERLTRSLNEISMAWPCSTSDYLDMLRTLISRNQLQEGSIYVQVTRGVAERDFAYPKNTPTSMMAFSSERQLLNNPLADKGVSVVSVPDLRWKRRDIKSLNLLAQCMAKQEAVNQGAYEAWMVEDSRITEGSSSSAFIVKDGCIITRALSNAILPGIRRRVIIELTEKEGLLLEQRPFSVEEAHHADEAFLSNASSLVLPVVSVDGKSVGDGRPGPVTKRLRELYIATLLAEAARK